MLFSKSAEHGIRASLYLAALQPEGFLSIRDISDRLHISFHFLTKIFQKLTRAGIVTSFRGPRGGVRLAHPASAISLKDIMVAIDGDDLFHRCMLGLPGCGDLKPCPLHEQWATQRARIESTFDGISLEQAAIGIRSRNVRLTWTAPDEPAT